MLDACDVTFLIQTGLEIAAGLKQHLDKKEEMDAKTAEPPLQPQSQEDR